MKISFRPISVYPYSVSIKENSVVLLNTLFSNYRYNIILTQYLYTAILYRDILQYNKNGSVYYIGGNSRGLYWKLDCQNIESVLYRNFI